MISDFDIDLALRNIDALSPDQKARVLSLLEERNKLDRLHAGRTDFLKFVNAVWPTFIGGPHHRIMADAFNRVAEGKLKRLIIDMAPRHCLALDTPINTTDGWKTMGTIQPGDWVFGADGKPVEVVGKSPTYYDRECFKVITGDGEELVTDSEHLWSIAIDRRRPDKFKLATTENLFLRQVTAREFRRPWVPDTQPIRYPEAPEALPIKPYLFGMWIGNGHKNQAIITCDGRDLEHVRANIEEDGDRTTDQATPLTFGVLNLKVRLRTLGVLGNKRIPDAYMRASIADRWQLVYGLFDSDGCASKDGQLSISTSDPALRDQYRELLWSLGIRAHLHEIDAVFNGKNYGKTWRVSFYATDFGRAPRKRGRTLGQRKPVRRYLSFEKHPTVPVQCIEVASPEGLFLAGRGMVVTHNTKSEFASWLLPAWFLGKFPTKQIIQVSNTESLAAGFGRRVRNLIGGEGEINGEGLTPYQELFPGIDLAKDSQAAAEWHTNKGGRYFAVGVNGKVTGKGADIAIVDDPHSEQEAKQAESNPAIFDAVYDWYTSGIRQRLQPGGAIIIVMTRWSKRDLVGKLVARMEEDIRSGMREGVYDDWEIIELPAILDEGLETERPMWPGFWKLEELQATRNALPIAKWKAQYQQQPTSEEGAILKREYWKRWGVDTEFDLAAGRSSCPGTQHMAAWRNLEPPACEYIISSWDTALKKNERADYSAMTTWGIFKAEDLKTGKLVYNAILLGAYKARMEFPELKHKVKQFYNEDLPDTLLIEDKGSGTSLIQELRSMGVPVENFSYGRGSRAVSNDKIARANMISDVFASGYVWAPERRYADEVIAECAEFPAAAHDDYVDSVVQAMIRFRAGGFIQTANDVDDEDDAPRYVRKRYY